MNQLKSTFISVYFLLITAALSQVIYILVLGGFDLTWLGALLTGLPVLWLLGSAVLLNRPRTSPNIWALQGVTALGGALVAIAWIWTEPASWVGTAYAASMLAAFFAYVFWYSRFDRSLSAALTEGKYLPDFALDAANGQRWIATQVDGPLGLYLFFRGNWCPFCMAQVKELIERAHDFEARGVKIAFVSPQPQGHTRRLMARHGLAQKSSPAFIVDADNRIARMLGIAHPGGLPLGLQALGYGTDTVLPTLILTDRNGLVLKADQTNNYRVRPELDDFLAAADAWLGVLPGARKTDSHGALPASQICLGPGC
jgi:peroxiredoxin